jgi:Phage integrase family
VSHWFSRICRRAGLGHWHLHELRHSGASLMLAQGTDLYVVSEVLGHSSVAITKDVYGHLVEGQKRAAAARMSEVLLTPMAPAMAPRARPHRTRTLADREEEGFDKGKYLRTRRDSNPQPSDP